MRSPLALSKHEAAGNDFLVLVDPAGDRGSNHVASPALARAVCERRRGVGADGLIRLWAAGPGRVGMELFNADGSPAEVSGNGLRCVAQAAVEAGLATPPGLTVDTVVGPRMVELRPGPGPAEAWASVTMGPVALSLDVVARGPARRAALAEVGNPHLVAEVEDPWALDLAEAAAEVAGEKAGDLNVELVAGDGHGGLVLRVIERGAGATLACGTGSVAAAAAARAWGLVGERVAVANPGGTLEVMLPAAGHDGEAVLAGPVRHVADVVVTEAVLGEAGESAEALGVAASGRP